jgi:(4S)-4-hydroxy-5-phosphonooxypentane-2,3-dione isomerase
LVTNHQSLINSHFSSGALLAATAGQAVSFQLMHMIMVRLDVKPESLDDFIKLVTFNASQSRKEPGNLRFDVVRSIESPTRFALYEVYRDEAAVLAHQATSHYARWRAEIEALLVTPRVSEKFTSIFPEPYS